MSSYSKHYQSFLDDKDKFFKKIGKTPHQNKIEKAGKLAEKHDYAFIRANRHLIEAELTQLLASLKSYGKGNFQFWVECYYLSLELKKFQEAYGHSKKAKEYEDLANTLRLHCEGKAPETIEKSTLKSYAEKLSGDLVELASTPTSISKVKDKVSYWNIVRIYWIFCRLSLTNMLPMMRDFQFFASIEDLLGTKADVDGFVNLADSSAEKLLPLSVGIFLFRDIINTILTVKHTLFPSEFESTDKWHQRLLDELATRYGQSVNDKVWMVANTLTNYNKFFHISATTAGWLTAGFMLFDFAFILVQREVAERQYKIKKAQYKQEFEYYESKLKAGNALSEEKRKQYKQHRDLLKMQITELDNKWKAQNATFKFNAAAALMIAAGFTGSLFFAAPILIIPCYMLSMAGVAMYLTANAYKDYKEKRLKWEQARIDHDPHVDYFLKQYEAARNEYIFTLVKNIVMPSLLLTMYAVCWQAALVLTALYIGYEIYRSYSQHKEKHALPEPAYPMIPGVDYRSEDDNGEKESEDTDIIQNNESEGESNHISSGNCGIKLSHSA